MDRPRMARRFTARADAPPAVKFWNVRAAKDEDDADEIFIYDEIGFDWFGDGITAASFAKDLAQLKSDRLTLRVNSPGGDVFDGIAIGNLLREHEATKTVKVDALAASIASVIAVMASSGEGDSLVMGPYSQMMIHDASGFAMGNAADMLDMAALLDMISDNIAQVYADAAGGEPKDWRATMRDEKWYTADEAVAAGLADRVDGDDAEDGCGPRRKRNADDAERLRVAAGWCDRLFPGHAERYREVLDALPATGNTDTPAGAPGGPGAVSDPAQDPALPAPAAQAEGDPVPDTPSGTGSPDRVESAFAWDASTLDTLRRGARAATAPPQIDLGDWRAWFREAPAARQPERDLPVDLGPPPVRQPAPEAPSNPLAELIRGAVTLTANDQPEPDAPKVPEPELPAMPPVRIDVAALRRAVRESRF